MRSRGPINVIALMKCLWDEAMPESPFPRYLIVPCRLCPLLLLGGKERLVSGLNPHSMKLGMAGPPNQMDVSAA